jgi:hypothetical protein
MKTKGKERIKKDKNCILYEYWDRINTMGYKCNIDHGLKEYRICIHIPSYEITSDFSNLLKDLENFMFNYYMDVDEDSKKIIYWVSI